MLLNSKVNKPRVLPTLAKLTTYEDALSKIVITFQFWPLNWLLSCKIQASNIPPFIQVVSFECYLWGYHLPKHRGCLDVYITSNFSLSIPVELTTRTSVTCSFCNFQPFTFPCTNVLLGSALKQSSLIHVVNIFRLIIWQKNRKRSLEP